MIKAGIFGAPDLKTKELVRLLLNHPDIELTCIVSPRYTGKKISSVIGDLYGDTELCFSGSLDASALNVLFICNDTDRILSPEKLLSENEKLKIVSLEYSPDPDSAPATIHGSLVPAESDSLVYGLPEINRKALVRGARAAYCPTPLAMATVLALFPLAKNLILTADIDVSVVSPDRNIANVAKEITTALQSIQTSFNSAVNISYSHADSLQPRTTTVQVTVHCNIDTSEIRRLFDEAYDDHNFTYLLPSGTDADPENVLRTNKCLISIEENSDGELMITSTVDNLLKGAAGNAVHCMNLLFMLHEKTGLSLIGGADFHRNDLLEF